MISPENMKEGVKKFLARNRQKKESD